MMRNVKMKPLKNASNFRKLAMGNWDGVGDPQVYALLELDCTSAQKYLDDVRTRTGQKITVNHLLGRIIALTLKKYPQLNGMIARSRIYLRESVDVFFQVGLKDAETELVGINIRRAEEKGIITLATEMNRKVEAVKKSSDHPIRKAQQPFRFLPWPLVRLLVKFIGFLQYDCNLNLAAFGLPRDPCGSIMITTIGSLGLDLAFVPLTHIGRTPAQIAVGKISPKPVVVNNEIVIRPILNLCCTFDHRFMDGILGAKMTRYVKEVFENAEKYQDLLETDSEAQK